ncbi:hypothetical protein BY996DRAFT_6411193 [Phakopsora pachyrhizi]|nr:hypothetical protein BY996DRAFT_6411193 [Phakopsora pachyrhizi]
MNAQEKNQSLKGDSNLRAKAGSLFSGNESSNSGSQDGSLFCGSESSEVNQGAEKMRDSPCAHSNLENVSVFDQSIVTRQENPLGSDEFNAPENSPWVEFMEELNAWDGASEKSSIPVDDSSPRITSQRVERDLENQSLTAPTLCPSASEKMSITAAQLQASPSAVPQADSAEKMRHSSCAHSNLENLARVDQSIVTQQEIPLGSDEFNASENSPWLEFMEELNAWDGTSETSPIPVDDLPSRITSQRVENDLENQSLTVPTLCPSASEQMSIKAAQPQDSSFAAPQVDSGGAVGYTGEEDVGSSSLPPLVLPKKRFKTGATSASATEKARKDHKNALTSLIKAPAVKLFSKIAARKPSQSGCRIPFPTIPTNQFATINAPTSQFILPTAPNPMLSTTQIADGACLISESSRYESAIVSGTLSTSILQQSKAGAANSTLNNILTKTKPVTNLSATKKAVKDHKDKSRSTIKDSGDSKKGKKKWDKTGEKAACPICSKELSAKGSNMKRHINSAHSSTKFVCPFCGKELKYPGDVKRHIKSKHPNAPKEQSGSTNIDPNLNPLQK